MPISAEFPDRASKPSISASSEHPVPRLSVIIATRQAAQSLEQCVLSTLEQEFAEWELLIADAASTDGTVDLIRKYEDRIAWWRSAQDSGIYDAWNCALAQARGEYVCFLGADDSWIDTRALARLFAAIGDDAYDLVTSRGLMVDRFRGKEQAFGSAWDFRRVGRRMVVCHPGLLHRRSLFDRYGAFDCRYRIVGDLDFLLRLPPDLQTLHVATTTVLVDGSGVSRRNVRARLLEQREALARCNRYGPLRAYVAWLDKCWRLPIARLLGIPH